MISRPRPLSELGLVRAAATTTGIAAVGLTPVTIVIARGVDAGQKLYIGTLSTLLVLFVVALVVGVAREALRAVRQMQVLKRARRRRPGAMTTSAMMHPMAA